MDLAVLEETLAARGEPGYRAGQVWEWAARGAAGFDEMTNLPAALRAELARDVPFSTLSVEAEARSPRRYGQDALPHARRPSARSGADDVPRRAPLALPLLAVGLPAHVHVLRDRPDAVPAQPDRVRDPRPGAALPPARPAHPRGVHGDGRADDEPRRRARGRATAPRSRDHAPANDDLDGRLAAGPDALRVRGRGADPARALAPRGRRCAALDADAGQPPLPARGRAGRVRALARADGGRRSSSST